MTKKSIAVAALIVALAGPAAAGYQMAQYEGYALSAHDGDTLRVGLDTLVCGQVVRNIRLADGVDAPELDQPMGHEAAERLRELVANKQLVLEVYGRSFDRLVADVRILPGGESLGETLVREGLAQVDPRHAKKNSPLWKIQAEAKAERRGLWGGSEKDQTSPWIWRKNRKGGAK